LGHDRDEPAWNRCSIKPVYADLTGAPQIDVQQKQGHAPFGVEMKITDDGGNRLPWDGKTFGKVRGPVVARAYFKENIEVLDDEGISTPAMFQQSILTGTWRSPIAPRT
jgi:fatty-acyl-CoA synthase